MVCSIGSGKMAAMARLLAAVSFSEIITEDVGSQKLTAKYVQKELLDADEANLLDEEDMHVYDLMPLTDPLHLVCCNACRKPIKTSQFVAHAEICKSVEITEEMISGLDASNGKKKRPKKERKKPTAAYASTPSERERLNHAEADAKRNSSNVNGAPTIDGPGAGPGISEYSMDAIPPPAKRSKSSVEAVDKSDLRKLPTGVAKIYCLNTQELHTCGRHLKVSTGGCKQCSDCEGNRKSDQVHGFGLQFQSKEIPAPLATKMFYSLRNHRLRSAVKYMYYETFSEEQSDDVHLNVSQGDEMELQLSFPCHGELNVRMEKGEKQPSTFATLRKPEQLADSSDVYMDKLGKIPAIHFFKKDPVISSLNSQATANGNMRSNYISHPVSFAGHSATNESIKEPD